ncbi:MULTISPECIES: GNAT family N-acetyltransferase [Brevibacillus]|jgi:ribosomal protein S18 acetylase RimI-like enzyme|uniref:Predicted N-acetyltransferase YhbS n=2 Tax=Brevibacillus TaxID=55080 RepID=A0A1I3QGR7_9BACL|nr:MULTISPECIES: GNAT family N-acetyltransferase [Brevibacillus]MEC2129398.1 GNAT family N-acetyltransferase [Brevibacillus centrosporus]MED1794941.1 GNAT family N-acetyltransferase [Brevibacillus nitrificans]MED1950440.1 GNAT family N-acetyltransferase [Brevibacillus centrosporus]MED4908822.1 GNAT family N-acetyltransferase [Brevibacillus centrosporus]RNB65594.1 GNAT family N-acetyltransferase [Brevibacillus centrosporus]
MLIRPFRLGDYSAITSIWQETGLDQSDTESLNDLAQQLAWDSDLVMVAEKEGKVIGVVVGTIDGARAYFYRLAVLPSEQGTGIGRQLVEAIEKRFKQRGVNRVLIMVNQDNPEVLPFYHSLGYEMQKYVTLSKKLSS